MFSFITPELIAHLVIIGVVFFALQITAAILVYMERKVAAIPYSEWKMRPRYALFSAGEFEERLVLAAREQGALLIGGAELYRSE